MQESQFDELCGLQQMDISWVTYGFFINNVFYFMAHESPLPKGQHLCAFPRCFSFMLPSSYQSTTPHWYQITLSLMPQFKNIPNELLLWKQPVTWGWKYIQLPNHLIIQTTVWSHYYDSISARNADGTFTH
jgi:hypothetical protein